MKITILIALFTLTILSCTQSSYVEKGIKIEPENEREKYDKKFEKIKIAYTYNNAEENFKKNQDFIKSLHILAKKYNDIELFNIDDEYEESPKCIIQYNSTNLNHLSIKTEKYINISASHIKKKNVYNIGLRNQPNTHLASLCSSLKNLQFKTFSILTTKSPSLISDIQNTCTKEDLIMLNKNIATNKKEIIKFASNLDKSVFVDYKNKIVNITHRDKNKLNKLRQTLNLKKITPDVLIFVGNVDEFNEVLKVIKVDQKVLFLDGINTDPKGTLDQIQQNKTFYYHSYDIDIVSHNLSFYKKEYNETTPLIYPILEEAILLCQDENPSVISDNKIENGQFFRIFHTHECQRSNCTPVSSNKIF